jgi:hypothetical protein
MGGLSFPSSVLLLRAPIATTAAATIGSIAYGPACHTMEERGKMRVLHIREPFSFLM